MDGIDGRGVPAECLLSAWLIGRQGCCHPNAPRQPPRACLAIAAPRPEALCSLPAAGEPPLPRISSLASRASHLKPRISSLASLPGTHASHMHTTMPYASHIHTTMPYTSLPRDSCLTQCTRPCRVHPCPGTHASHNAHDHAVCIPAPGRMPYAHRTRARQPPPAPKSVREAS